MILSMEETCVGGEEDGDNHTNSTTYPVASGLKKEKTSVTPIKVEEKIYNTQSHQA